MSFLISWICVPQKTQMDNSQHIFWPAVFSSLLLEHPQISLIAMYEVFRRYFREVSSGYRLKQKPLNLAAFEVVLHVRKTSIAIVLGSAKLLQF